MNMLGWYIVLVGGALDLLSDEDEMFDVNVRCSPRVAQGARSTVVLDGSTFPCVRWEDNDVVLCAIAPDGSTRVMHELPPAPSIGEAEADHEATLAHGQLATPVQYRTWLRTHGEEAA